MKYKHIVFDIDGTLIDTEYAVLHSLQETIKGLSGREIPCSELRFALGITGKDALKKLEIKDTSYAIELWDKNMRNYTNTIKVFDGIVELLKNLISLDYEIGIVTSKTREEFTHDFCPFGINHYFKIIICADDTQEHKPNAAPILKYMELNYQKQTIVKCFISETANMTVNVRKMRELILLWQYGAVIIST